MPDSPADRPVLLFDLDGTLLDSAPGIIAAQQQAMIEVGLTPAPESVLRSDIGPPPAVIFARLGMNEALIDDAVLAYRRHYLDTGIGNAQVYPGVRDVLNRLGSDYRLATATMKRADTAAAFLAHHGLDDHFETIGGARDGAADKPAIIAGTRAALGDPDPGRMIMIGDRQPDISGGQQLGLHTIAVTWGYGSSDELRAAAADATVDCPRQLPRAITRLLTS